MKLTNKKIMILNFPLLDVGGICTWTHLIIKGFRKLGFEADHFYCTPTGRIKCSETDFTPIGKKYKRGEKIPSKSLSYCDLSYFNSIIDDYDYVIFAHPSPHPTKANVTNEKVKYWKKLYKLCDKPKVVVFHDKKWHITNKWFLDVINHIDVILADQHNFIDSVKHYASHAKHTNPVVDWLFFPLDVPENKPSNDRKDYICVMPQWIKWKNHHLLLEVADNIKVPLHLYNGGMQYHYLTKTDEWKNSIYYDHVEDELVNEGAIHEYFGFVTYSKVQQVYNESLGSIDLTTRTYQNFTHHECSLHGSILLCTEECREGPYNHIHEGEYWSIDTNRIDKSINEFVKCPDDLKEEIRQKAYIRTARDFNCVNIAAKINSIVESLKF